MKKALVIFFCLQVLSGNTFAMEALKLPSMIGHYFEHGSSEHPGLGFGAYLWEHYVETGHADEDGHCDEKLPFKHCHDCCSHHATAVTCVVPETANVKFVRQAGEEVNFAASEPFISFYHCCIWQPPKID